MNKHGTVSGSAWLPSLLAIVVIALLVLLVFGATPSALLQIPQNAFAEMKASSDAAKKNAPPGTAAAAPVTASPAPGSSAAPSPAAAFDLAALANSPAEWPKTVILKEAVDFSGFGKENHVGAGAEVKLDSISGANLTVEAAGSTAIVRADKTDLKERVMATRARAGSY